MRLTELEIIKFGQAEPTKLVFHDGPNVFLGKNGSGKTTLLNLIVCVLNFDFTRFKHLEFDLRWRLEHQGVEVLMTAASRPSIINPKEPKRGKRFGEPIDVKFGVEARSAHSSFSRDWDGAAGDPSPFAGLYTLLPHLLDILSLIHI